MSTAQYYGLLFVIIMLAVGIGNQHDITRERIAESSRDIQETCR